MAARPRFDQIAAQLDAIPREHVPAALARLAARALEASGEVVALQAPDRWLTPDEVATRLGVHRRWVYQHQQRLGARKLSHRKLRVPQRGLQRYLAQVGRSRT